jgi:hypothetical protein
LATAATAGVVSQASTSRPGRQDRITVNPYRWEGPYAQHRIRHRALHDWRLCAEVVAPWFGACEKIILRTSEVVGHEDGFLYDDHFPPSEPNGRGKNYHHIPFEWQVLKPGAEILANCLVPGKATFSLGLTAREDFLDIQMSIRNLLDQPMKNADWAFCAVAFEAPTISDSEQARTYLYDGQRLAALGDIAGRDMRMYPVAGAHGFIPVGHRALPLASIEAKASVVILEALDGAHAVALGFEQADHIYGDAKGNKCFHADPYFGPLIDSGQERRVRGRMYLIEGNASQALKRFQQDSACNS